MRACIERNARIRTESTRNLIDAAMLAGVRRFIVQSIAWAYAPDPERHEEAAPPDHAAADPRPVSVRGIVALESAVPGAAGMDALVLRYGPLYGPGTAAAAPPDPRLSVHVDAAAYAVFLAIKYGAPGVYNIAEQDASVTSAKARNKLLWSPTYRVQVEPLARKPGHGSLGLPNRNSGVVDRGSPSRTCD
jgi:nucleoside-diphosphate-sugar epimerase